VIRAIRVAADPLTRVLQAPRSVLWKTQNFDPIDLGAYGAAVRAVAMNAPDRALLWCHGAGPQAQ